MILLDTNVVSNPLLAYPDSRVAQWLDNQAAETLFLSTISLAELYSGIAIMPEGKRKSSLVQRLREIVLPVFTGRILAFDSRAAEEYAYIKAQARKCGRAVAVADGYIAAIARVNKLAVASRDVSPFEAAEVQVINPWTM